MDDTKQRIPKWYQMRQPISVEEVAFLLTLLHDARRNAQKQGEEDEAKMCEKLIVLLDAAEEV